MRTFDVCFSVHLKRNSTLRAELFDETYDVFSICIISPFWDKTVSWNPSYNKTNDALAM